MQAQGLHQSWSGFLVLIQSSERLLIIWINSKLSSWLSHA